MAQVIPAEIELVWDEARRRPRVLVALFFASKESPSSVTWRLELCAQCSQKLQDIAAGLLPVERPRVE